MKIFLTLAICIFSLGISAQNILENSDFEKGKNPWVLGKYNGATGTFSINDSTPVSGSNSAHVHIKEPSTYKEDVKLFQIIEVKSGATYEISFRAKANMDQEISIEVSNDLAKYWTQNITIKKDKSTYGPFLFESTDTDLFSLFALNLGNVDDIIEIDSIVMNELTPSALQALESSGKSHDFSHVFKDNQLSLVINNPAEQFGLVSITDFSGRVLYSKDLQLNESEIYVDPIMPGLYLLEMTIDNKYISQKLLLR